MVKNCAIYNMCIDSITHGYLYLRSPSHTLEWKCTKLISCSNNPFFFLVSHKYPSYRLKYIKIIIRHLDTSILMSGPG